MYDLTRRQFFKFSVAVGALAVALHFKHSNKELTENIKNYFYDDDNFGPDDELEKNYETIIEQFSNLEKYIQLTKDNYKKVEKNINKKTREILNEEVTNDYEEARSNNTYLEFVSPENFEQLLNENPDSIKDERQRSTYFRELYKNQLLITNHLNTRGYEIISEFGLNLVKAIIKDSLALDDNISLNDISIDPRLNYNPENQFAFTASCNGNKIRIETDSPLYNLMDQVYACQYNDSEYQNAKFNGELNEELLNDHISFIEYFKDCFELEYGSELSFENNIKANNSVSL